MKNCKLHRDSAVPLTAAQITKLQRSSKPFAASNAAMPQEGRKKNLPVPTVPITIICRAVLVRSASIREALILATLIISVCCAGVSYSIAAVRASAVTDTDSTNASPPANRAVSQSEHRNLTLTSAHGEYELGLACDILEDKTHRLTIDSVASAQMASRFVPSRSESPNYGASRSTFWLRLVVRNASDIPYWILESRYPLLDTIELYEPYQVHPSQSAFGADSARGSDSAWRGGQNAGWRVTTLGDAMPFSKRALPYRTCRFRIPIQTGEPQVLYIRVVTNGTMIIACTLRNAENMVAKEYTERLWQGVFFGIMIIMLAYNLFLFVGVRDVTYLYYVLYLGSFIIYQMTLDGSAFEYLWGEFPLWNNIAYPFWAAVTSGLAQQFARSFLETQNLRSRFWDRLLVTLISIAAIVAVVSFVAPYRLMLTLVSLYVAVSCVLTLLVAIVAVKAGSKPAQYFLIGWGVFLVAIFFLATITFGLVPFTFTIWNLTRIAATLEVALLSLGLAYRVNLLREEKERAEMVHQTNIELTSLNDTLNERNSELQELNERLDEANSFKTKMVGMVSHDLKNPLSTILGCTQLLTQSLPKNYADHDLVEDIQMSANRMLRLVKDLLDSSAIELGKMQLRNDLVPWSHLVLGITERYHAAALKKEQMLDVSGIRPCVTIGDSERLQQVVDNLVSNAVKFSRLGGTIAVRLYVRDAAAVLEVQDDGPGFTDEDKEKMFGHFQRLSALPTGDEHSSGIGLSIVKKIVELHAGTIRLQSEFGKGSTFIVELPAVAMEDETQIFTEE